MEPPLSSYWVKFFKNAGFPTDVATRHALIFSNNRIKPDMLPDLDKPSLKEMGISLMGDMIAILRYAKKVVDETTTKKFLVNTEDSPSSNKTTSTKPPIRKVPIKAPLRSLTSGTTFRSTIKSETASKIVKPSANSNIKPNLTIKKKVTPVSQSSSRLYSDYVVDNNSRPKTTNTTFKRKYDSDEDINGKWIHNDDKRFKPNDGIPMKYFLKNNNMSKNPTSRGPQQILKMDMEQNKNVFHRLGDSLVSSTTNIPDSSSFNFGPTFNVTGLERKDTYKPRTNSVFNRLGDKDYDKPAYPSRPERNGNTSTHTQGILKTRTPLLGMKSVLKKPMGTMRADEEINNRKTSVSDSVKYLMKAANDLGIHIQERNYERNYGGRGPVTGKLASERIELPAKSRLGASKQVTFNNMTTVNHFKKPRGVFSRLGV